MTPTGAIALCVLMLLGGCERVRDDDGDEQAAPPRVDAQGRVVLTAGEREAIGLQTLAATEGKLTTTALRFGKVVARPQEDALVVAPVTGRLAAPTLTLGAEIAEDDPIAILEPLVDTASRATLEAQRRELRGRIDGARAQVEAKRADLARVATLVSSGLATEAVRAGAEAALSSEQARVESLRRASSELARMTGGRMVLRAHVSGVLVALTTDAGALVQQGSVLARIVKGGPRWVDVAVPPGDPVGSGYLVGTAPDGVAAVLSTRGAVVQPDGTRRDRLQVAQAVAGGLFPGATVAVQVLHEARGVLVQTSALVRRGRETLVFVESAQGRYVARPVEVEARDGERAAIRTGVTAGEGVVTRGGASLLGELDAEGQGRAPGVEE